MKSDGQFALSVSSSAQASLSVTASATAESSPLRVAALYLMGSIGDANLSIRQPISLILESDQNGGFLVSDAIFAVYGEGPSPRHAIGDYRSSLEEYFYLLQNHSEQTPEDQQQFLNLKNYVDIQPRLLEFKGN